MKSFYTTLSVLFALLLISSCGYFSDGYAPPVPTITSVENTDDGVLLTYDPGTSEEVQIITVEYRKPTQSYSTFRQIILPATGENRVLFTGPDDGDNFLRIIVATDELYGTSEEIAFNLISPVFELPCTLANNSIRSNFSPFDCNGNAPSVTGALDRNGELYVITANCDRNYMTFEFPRKPTNGIFQTTDDDFLLRDDPRGKFVTVTVVGTNFFNTREFQDVYVSRVEGGTEIAFCSIPLGQRPNTFERTVRGRFILPD
ncbi:hypothetical protein [Lewinella sp. 4G2]|uniref:hypothetical protein n=1 Tax=Lewinella sp. 4G2 TaxID=1803372 RepID=UPI0007B4980D|nr:hypothetical protein [Lewinella sp. 4G2]OAV44791.1 hypothetical protein A3850_009950 [Lewinella sp. 4G2]